MAPRRNSVGTFSQFLFKHKDVSCPIKDRDYLYVDKVQMLFDANQKELRKQLHSITAKARKYTVAETQTDPFLELEDTFSIPEDLDNIREKYVKLMSMNKRLVERNEKLEEKFKVLEENLRIESQNNVAKLLREEEEKLKLANSQHHEQIAELEDAHKTELYEKEMLLKNCQMQLRKLEEEKYDCEKNVKKVRCDNLKLTAENRILRNDNKALERNIAMVRAEMDDRYKKVACIESLTRKYTESEREKRIIIDNFRKLERERDHLLRIINDNIESIRKANFGKTERLLERITNFENRLDAYELQ
uniref:Uncharacterized protein n=1 Tax=Syphacia muris TaxID=451379 RepID=A0A158R5P4_9BILA